MKEYITTRTIICETRHKTPCSTCTPLLNIAKSVISNRQIQLLNAFKLAYPTQTYKTDIALARLLQMPLVSIKPCLQKVWFLVKLVEGIDYVKFVSLLDALFSTRTGAVMSPSISQSELNAVLTLAQSDRKRQLIRYSVFKASGMSYTAARKSFGFGDTRSTETCVLNAIKEARATCEAIDELQT